MELRPYRVKPNSELSHNGEILPGGRKVELQPRIADEIRHLVDPLNEAGEVQPWGSPDDVTLEQQLAAALPHERVSLLEQAIERTAGDLSKLKKALADEVAAQKAKPKGMTAAKTGGPAPGGAGVQS